MVKTDSQIYAEAIRAAFFYQAKKVIFNQLVSKFAFLGGSFFGPLVGMLASYLATGLAKDGKLLVYFQYIDMRVDGQSSDYGKASMDYYNAVNKGDKNEIARVEKILDEKFDKLISFRSV